MGRVPVLESPLSSMCFDLMQNTAFVGDFVAVLLKPFIKPALRINGLTKDMVILWMDYATKNETSEI